MMAGLAFTEEIRFYTATVSADNQGGKSITGETLSLSTLASIQEKILPRTSTDGQLTFNQMLKVEIWKNPAFIPTETTQVEWKNKRYTIQAIAENETHTKQVLTLIARA
ncbi:hypothetical protein [Emticicia sp. BO119]|uniref:hypothetical protein n=1 Tax=Emticicia sp. BO119 TaxID=2757768 RepID=UPI0015F013DA|nr:hypothetical protein [Emticicia sp. BO119]MBA4851349.1 hypothetical protein [Emticicia sp. BO119]